MDSYPYNSIVCNGRQVLIDDIIYGKDPGTSPFEEALFKFMRQWLSSVDTFQLTTSGSTGTPKNIVITRRQMIASANLTSQALKLQRGQTALICLDPEYIAGKMMVVRSLVTGLAIIAVSPASNPLKQVTQHIDFTAMVPLQVHELLHASNRDAFLLLRTVIIGGGPIDAQDVALLKDLPCRFYATYGMTETVSHIALRQLNGDGASSYFQALPGITLSLDERGCLIIHWPDLGNSIVTNDLVQLVDEVRFVWLGRWDNVINSGGKKILPEKLEATIADLFLNAGHRERFFVSSVPDARLGSKLVMVIEGDFMNQNYSELYSILKSSLQAHETPKDVFFCKQFRQTQTGKINRIATLESALSNFRLSD